VAGVVGAPFTYTITATNSPTVRTFDTRPAWMTINTATGVASGVPDAAGTFSTYAIATNADGTGSKPVTITIVAPGGTGARAAHHGSGGGCGLGMNAAALLMLLVGATRRKRGAHRG
jgi:hypothetical protein